MSKDYKFTIEDRQYVVVPKRNIIGQLIGYAVQLNDDNELIISLPDFKGIYTWSCSGHSGTGSSIDECTAKAIKKRP